MLRKLLEIKDEKLCSINQKYGATLFNKKPNLFTTKKYKETKKLAASLASKDIKLTNFIKLVIVIHAYVDFDAYIKPLVDGLEMAGTIDNDRNIIEANIIKLPQKRGKPSSVTIFGEDFKEYPYPHTYAHILGLFQ